MTTANNPADDFDFFIGRWRVAHKRLQRRLAACAEWVEFPGECVVQKMLGGLGNVDDNILELPEGAYRALTLRSFNRETQQWAIWWLDSRHPWTLDVPVKGGFENGVGLFYADDELNGQLIKVRFRWSMPAPEQPRWEQAFSPDAGETWETNWVMDFIRADAGSRS